MKAENSPTEKKKIIIDLDVVTVAKWDKGIQGDAGRAFLKRIEQREFSMVTLYILFDLIREWKHERLRKEIKDFFDLFSESTISLLNLQDRISTLKIDRKELIKNIAAHQVKDEDAILAMLASIFSIDFLVTFNRKHLGNKKEEINDVLQKFGLKPIRIILPGEI